MDTNRKTESSNRIEEGEKKGTDPYNLVEEGDGPLHVLLGMSKVGIQSPQHACFVWKNAGVPASQQSLQSAREPTGKRPIPS